MKGEIIIHFEVCDDTAADCKLLVSAAPNRHGTPPYSPRSNSYLLELPVSFNRNSDVTEDRDSGNIIFIKISTFTCRTIVCIV